MKKRTKTCVCLLVMILAFAATIPALAASELLTNGSFETGDMTTFFSFGPSSVAVVGKEYAHTGEYGLSVSNRQGIYATAAIDATKLIKQSGPGIYKLQAWARHAPGASGDRACVVLNYRLKGASENKYLASPYQELTQKWQKLSFEKVLYFEETDEFDHVYLYVQSFRDDKAGDIWIDDFSLRKTEDMPALSGQYAPVDVKNAKRDPITTVGAIRWDAWYTHDGVENSVISQVERSLSPARFHFRAPFFARVTEDNKIEIPAYTQEIFDQELLYAASAGIDYFAYLYYDSDMKAARLFHQSSQYREQVKFAMILSGGQFGNGAVQKEMKRLLTEPYYMTVMDGHPLIYYYLSGNYNGSALIKDIAYYRELSVKLGIKTPFIALMGVSANEPVALGADAVTAYAVSGSGNAPYTTLAAAARNRWLTWLQAKAQHVPLVTMGWQNEPRIENNVTWIGAMSGDSFVQYATPEEIEAHVYDALSYAAKEGSAYTKANTILIYAWNEHDEGGWICPTIAVDENGRQEYDEGGIPLVNDEHLRAVANAIRAFRPQTETPAPTETANETPTETNTDEPSATPDASAADTPSATARLTETPYSTPTPPEEDVSPLWFLLPAAALAVAGAVVCVVVLKKRAEKTGK